MGNLNCKSVNNIDQIILVTSQERNCDCLVDIAESENIACIRDLKIMYFPDL